MTVRLHDGSAGRSPSALRLATSLTSTVSAANEGDSVGPTIRCVPWNHSVVPPHRRVVPAVSRAAACLLAAIAIGGCASTTSRTFDASDISSSTPAHGSLTDAEFKVAVAVARAEAAKDSTTSITSATATVGAGIVTDANYGPPCTSGTLLHIKLIGTFNIVIAGGPTDGASSATASSASAPSGGVPTDGSGYSVTAVLITADPASGKACLLSVQIGPVAPDPGATLLFRH